jgi:hypothetical protein
VAALRRAPPRLRGIAGATGARYVAVRADRGHRLRLVLTLRNALGRAVVRSALSAVVR